MRLLLQRDLVCQRAVGLVTGYLEPEDLTPQQQDEFVELYRRWRAEGG